MNSQPPPALAPLLTTFDLRLRLICGAALLMATVVAQGAAAQIAGACVAAMAALLCEYKPIALIKRMALVTLTLLPLWVILPLPLGDTPRMDIAGLSLDREGVWAAMRTTRIALTVGLLGFSFFAPIPDLRLAWALQRLRVPGKLIALLTYASLSLTHLQQDRLRLTRAWRARGFEPNLSPFGLQTFGNGIGLLLASAARRGRNMEAALAMRGFYGQWPNLNVARPGRPDWLVFIFWMLALLLIASLTLVEVLS
jgi:cobalt/nickel transport system permease protein